MKATPAKHPRLNLVAAVLLLVVGLCWLAISYQNENAGMETVGIESLVPAESKFVADFSEAETNPDIVDSGGFRTEANSGSLSYLATNKTASADQPQSAKIRAVRTAGKAESRNEASTSE